MLQVVTGFGETGARAVPAGVDKVAFTGSTATGKKVMAACAETLTPVVIEAGGKDALLVDEDADLEAAADAALWGACANAGQTCTGVERVYVHERVYDEFLADADRQGHGTCAPTTARTRKIGPITMPSSSTSSARHIAGRARPRRPGRGRRRRRGGRAVRAADRSWSTYRRTRAAVQEETFGPTVTVAKVRDMDEAIERDQRHPLRPRLDGVLQGARHGARRAGSAPA